MAICLLLSSQNRNAFHYSINRHPSWETEGDVETKETSTTYFYINFVFSCIQKMKQCTHISHGIILCA